MPHHTPPNLSLQMYSLQKWLCQSLKNNVNKKIP
jgi:hypothetical protein